MFCWLVVCSDLEEGSDDEGGPSQPKRSGSVFESDFYQKQFAKRRRVCWVHHPPYSNCQHLQVLTCASYLHLNVAPTYAEQRVMQNKVCVLPAILHSLLCVFVLV